MAPHKTNDHALIGYYNFHRIPMALRSVPFFLAYCGAPLKSFFVFPRTAFKFDEVDLYIPEHPCTYVNSAGQTDWIWQYQNAWHLLAT
jgi:hypothetical protein